MRVNDKSSEPPVEPPPSEEPGGGLLELMGDLATGESEAPEKAHGDGLEKDSALDSKVLFEERGEKAGNAGAKNRSEAPHARAARPGDVTIAAGSIEGRAAVIHGEGSFGRPGEGMSGRGSVEAWSASGSAQGQVGANRGDGQLFATGSAQARATLARAEGEVHASYRGVAGHGRGEVEVGAHAQAEGALVVDLRHGTATAGIKADLMAGAAASVQGDVHGAGLDLSAAASAYAGAGVKLDVRAGFDHGKVSLKWDVGAALGIGVGFKADVSVDIPRLAETAARYVPGAREAFEVATALGGLARAIGDLFGGDRKPAGPGPGAGSGAGARPAPLEQQRALDKIEQSWSGSHDVRHEYKPLRGEKKIGDT